MSDKPFLTIDEQVRLLESRGLGVDADTGPTLMREGYYSIVNGYKDPFLDVSKRREVGEDRYLEGISFSDLYTLFTFDRELRSLTFRYLILAELKLKLRSPMHFRILTELPKRIFFSLIIAMKMNLLALGRMVPISRKRLLVSRQFWAVGQLKVNPILSFIIEIHMVRYPFGYW